MRRRKMSKKASRKNFTRGTRTHRSNISGTVKRGGGRK